MAYPRPAYESLPPHDLDRSRPAWDPIQRSHYPTSFNAPTHHTMTSSGVFDPESESSDVSDDASSDPRSHGLPILPIALPPAPTKQALESLEVVDSRLRELIQIEDHNIKKRDFLKAKRARKDAKIRRIREAQDLKIRTIMDARARRDERIARRRKMEDDAFEHFDQDLEEEEMGLRKRQKRLKRGLPVEDMAVGSRISSVSMSPPGPAYAGIPPPSKRHQTGHPGQNDSPVRTTAPRPLPHSAPNMPSPVVSQPPPYAFLQTNHPPAPTSYAQSPTLPHSPSNSSVAFPPPPPLHHSRSHHQPQGQPSPYMPNGHPPSPQSSRPPTSTPMALLNTAPPPRPPTTYDTRPPPPSLQQPPAQPPLSHGPSSFATINTPPPSSFAPINPRQTSTPPAPSHVSLAKSADHERSNGHVRPFTSDIGPGGSTLGAGGKRTPSTTHPYQMSEAFANRHHHCERTDKLNRGIWTSYGPGGTKDMPTGAMQEMYLRCNHDGCRRIDWRTVHGLQCHIVKNHEQPKGTIGSLEKALDRYGVPVAEIEAHEREYGEGAGGTMADPKNFKLKTKPMHGGDKADLQRRSLGPQPNHAPYGSNFVALMGNSNQLPQGSPVSTRSLLHEDTEDSEVEYREAPTSVPDKSHQQASKFASINGGRSSTSDVKPSGTSDTMNGPTSSPSMLNPLNVPKRDGAFWRNWPEGQVSPASSANAAFSAPDSEKRDSNSGSTSAPAVSLGGNSNHNRSVSSTVMLPITKPASAAPEFPPNPSKQDGTLSQTLVRSNPHLQEAMTQQSTQSPANTNPQTNDTVVPIMHPPPKDTISPRPVIKVLAEKELTDKKDTVKERESSKLDVADSPRPEPKSPGVARRASIVPPRAKTPRRASVAAIQAISGGRDRDRERRDGIGLQPVKLEMESRKEAEKDAQDERDNIGKTEPDQPDNDGDPEDDQGADEDSDDPDTIKISSGSKDGKENRTTPRRQSNGRFLRRNR